ncbi:3 transmembrane domain protein [Sulfolobus ellipsoid virus 1]|uniref:3 transmembrane domain protein n=1 Tax=Sulfolobus ellipsoid virus 1 TaxID=2056194 RepID=A0A2H4RBM9_9VIRU|nr:3 transmembrane domain protein [Sulfolobus ellipsoid virus 1]ATY46491.1 3 transmembrane domain protein [Sulfolobus ellipsoid virus 1]
MSSSSNPNPNSKPSIGLAMIRIFVIVGIVLSSIGIPIGLYELGQLIGNHMAYSDLVNGYAYGGLFQVIYNATHVTSYQQLSQISGAMGTTLAVSDVNTISLALLLLGFAIGLPLAGELYLFYKKLTEES